MSDDPNATRLPPSAPGPHATRLPPAEPGPDAIQASPSEPDPNATRLPPARPGPAATQAPTAPATPAQPAPAPPPLAGPAGPVLPERQLAPPVYRPRAPRRKAALLLGAVSGLVIAGVAGAVGYALHGTGSSAPSPSAPFAVTSLRALGPVSALRCPTATLRVVASIGLTSAGGTLHYAWLLPDGSSTSPQELPVPAGQTSASITLTYSLSGSGSMTGFAALHVLSPSDVYSRPVPVRYLCA